MSILPTGVEMDRLVYAFQLAAFDLAIPDHLMGRKQDQREWSAYASALPPARLIHKFAEAVDSVLAVFPKKKPVAKLDQATSEKLYSRWMAAGILHVSISQRLNFGREQTPQNQHDSDIDSAMFFVEDLLKAVASPEAQDWSDRRKAYAATSTDEFNRFLSKMVVQERALQQNSPAP